MNFIFKYMVTKEMIAERVKDIANNEGPPYTDDFLYRLMYFDQEICDCVLWSRATVRFFKINLISQVVESKGILNDKQFVELSNHSLEEIKSALFEKEKEKEILKDLQYFWQLLFSLQQEMLITNPLMSRIHNKCAACLRQCPGSQRMKKKDLYNFLKEISRDCQKYCRARRKRKNDQNRERIGEIRRVAEGLVNALHALDWNAEDC